MQPPAIRYEYSTCPAISNPREVAPFELVKIFYLPDDGRAKSTCERADAFCPLDFPHVVPRPIVPSTGRRRGFVSLPVHSRFDHVYWVYHRPC
ncbi:hypothetical protein PAXRUDRAFT_216054 [Paxillus rubicundulus Ve08.2h10]|uniref:Uncharacterized protein n=1 Tax=Paxillus rubicundulus Ve08.2h10 TaxID=930991 RepID=A0A0D0CDS7_9AGAM|nr:hypothetical protein PAXRUDRAFT_216054 [Paxillus rubicundulus Ve08.2h10]